jgi:hypothetical protein
MLRCLVSGAQSSVRRQPACTHNSENPNAGRTEPNAFSQLLIMGPQETDEELIWKNRLKWGCDMNFEKYICYFWS